MHARVSTYRFPPDGLDEAVREFEDAVPKVQEMEGNKGAVLLVDRASAKGMTITYWESEQAMQGSTAAADEVREGTASAAGGSIESVEGYEVALQL